MCTKDAGILNRIACLEAELWKRLLLLTTAAACVGAPLHW